MTEDAIVELRVTDDELAALAVAVGAPCPVRLTTVDEADPSDLAAAVGRGRRSLVARAVLSHSALRSHSGSEERIDPAWGEIIAEPLRAAPALVVCAVDAEVRTVGELVQYFLPHPDTGRWTMVTSLGGGLHQAMPMCRADALDLVGAIVGQAAADEDPDAVLCLMSRSGDDVRSVLAGAARVRLREAPDGPDVRDLPVEGDVLTEVFEWLHLGAGVVRT